MFGITTSDFVHSVAMNMVWLALDERRIAGLPDWLIPVGDTGMGEYYVLDTSRSDDDGENPVVIWAAWGPQDVVEAVASDFGAFFLQVVHEQLGEFY